MNTLQHSQFSVPNASKDARQLLMLLLAAVSPSLLADYEPEKRFNGIPIYEIYEEKDILNTSRGNLITTSPNNTLFFCNDNGIHTFDGSNWHQVLATEATRDKIRSILWTKEAVYAASYTSVGKLLFDQKDGVKYHSLNKEALSEDASELYFDAIETENSIYFIGMRSVVSLDRNTEEIVSKSFGTWVKTAFVQNGSLYVTTDLHGLWKHVDGRFETVANFSKFKDENHFTFSDSNTQGTVAISTIAGTLHLIENETLVPAFERFDIKGEISDIAFVTDDRLAVSIAGLGIYIIDLEGNVHAALDSELDYRWAAARKLHLDKQGTLWAMFGSTVGKILLTSPITPIDERLRPALDYPISHLFDNNLYLRNHNRLYKAKHSKNGQLRGFENAFPNATFSVSLALATIDGIIIQVDETMYLLRDDQQIELGTHGRQDRLTSFKNDPNKFLGVSADHIRLYQRNGDKMNLLSEITHTAGLVNKIARDQNETFWLEIGLGSIGKVWISNGELQFKLYTESQGLPSDWFAIWEHEDKVLFTERSGIFEYNPTTDRFQLSDLFEAYFPRAIGQIHRAATDPDGNIWASYNYNNYILWKQEDGNYLKDPISLSHLGELYLDHFLFLDNGDAILATGSEMFHFSKERRSRGNPPLFSHIASISNLEGNETYFLDAGIDTSTPDLKLSNTQDNISIRISNTYSATLKEPSFQYFLEGMSKDWSKWSTSNELLFTNLKHGSYKLRIKTKLGEAVEFPEIALDFDIAASIYQTPTAFFVYFIGGCALLVGGFNFFSRNLKKSNEKLEQMVAERTKEIEHKNEELENQANALEQNAKELTDALEELRNAQDQLMTTSRKAGMAEVATNVLHNVGNVLNSINVAVVSLANNLEQHRIDKLQKVSNLINANEGNLADFLTNDPRGKAVPQYLTQLANVLKEDFALYGVEVDSMHENIDHVKKIIATQQAHAKTIDVFQNIKIADLVDSAVSLIMGDPEHAIFEVSRNFDEDLEINSDKHRILQIVANFIKNAKESINEAAPPLGMIDINGRFEDDKRFISLTIRDNGIGIEPENLKKIFTHGFTTKQDGHGFGLHSCANSARLLGGSLSIDSKGVNRGAIVTLRLPVRPPRKSTEVVSKKSAQASLN